MLLLIVANQPKLAEERFSELIMLRDKSFIASSEFECADKLLTAFQQNDV